MNFLPGRPNDIRGQSTPRVRVPPNSRRHHGTDTNREDVNTAPIEGLTPDVTQFLQGIFQNPQQQLQQFLPRSPQNQAIESQFLRMSGLSPSGQQLENFMPGADVVNAARPIFERNLQQGADTLRQSGPRFASNTERLVGEQGQRAMQDFNLFSQQVFESGRNRQLQALMGAGQFSSQNRQQNLQFLLPMLQQGLIAGGAASAPVITQDPGFLQGTALPLLGTAGTIAATAGLGPFGGAAVQGLGLTGQGASGLFPQTSFR